MTVVSSDDGESDDDIDDESDTHFFSEMDEPSEHDSDMSEDSEDEGGPYFHRNPYISRAFLSFTFRKQSKF